MFSAKRKAELHKQLTELVHAHGEVERAYTDLLNTVHGQYAEADKLKTRRELENVLQLFVSPEDARDLAKYAYEYVEHSGHSGGSGGPRQSKGSEPGRGT